MRNILNVSHSNVHSIALVLGTVSVFGYIVSFLRDRAFAHYFGPGELLDVYIASFRIPDLLFIVATAFISVYALLPMFEEKKQEGERSLREFIDTSFYFLLIFLILGGTLLFFLVPVLSGYFFRGLSPEMFDTFILFSRVFLLQAILFAVSNFFTGILQFKRKFFLYALLPIVYNLGIIFGVMVLYPMFGATGLMFGVPARCHLQCPDTAAGHPEKQHTAANRADPADDTGMRTDSPPLTAPAPRRSSSPARPSWLSSAR